VGKLTLDDGHDGALLDGRRALETVGVDSAEELSLQVHVVEGVGDLVVVGLDLTCTRVSLCAQKRLPVAVALRGAQPAENSPSGTSSRPFSAMIATGRSDYWCWTVVEGLLVAGLKRRILGIPPCVLLVVWEN
jgi:hypothetical protein